jgi:hypothetical protein
VAARVALKKVSNRENIVYNTSITSLKIRNSIEGGWGRVTSVHIDRKWLKFDAWIYDLHGVIYEAIRGIKMQDATQGRLRRPQWIKA